MSRRHGDRARAVDASYPEPDLSPRLPSPASCDRRTGICRLAAQAGTFIIDEKNSLHGRHRILLGASRAGTAMDGT